MACGKAMKRMCMKLKEATGMLNQVIMTSVGKIKKTTFELGMTKLKSNISWRIDSMWLKKANGRP